MTVGFCHTCGHVQLTELVPPAAMFEDYLYVSSASDTLKNHLYDLSDTLVQRYALGADDLVIDIGCNDGTLLRGFARHGVKTLGVDPAENLAALAGSSGTERYIGFLAQPPPRRSPAGGDRPHSLPPPTPSRTYRNCATLWPESRVSSNRAVCS